MQDGEEEIELSFNAEADLLEVKLAPECFSTLKSSRASSSSCGLLHSIHEKINMPAEVIRCQFF